MPGRRQGVGSTGRGDDPGPRDATSGDRDDDLGALESTLGVDFDDPGLLELALTHRSWAFENGRVATNERLEFLGDAVLGLAVADLIYRAHPNEQEGRLAKLRSAAVKTASLARVARQVGLGRHVMLGRGESASGGHDKDSILADTLEAVLGAVYLERGYDDAAALVARLLGPQLDELAGIGAALDFKTSLQELVAARFDSVPRYSVTSTGPDHEKSFAAQVEVDGRVLGHGQGTSKKRAEQHAARQAYIVLADAADAPAGTSDHRSTSVTAPVNDREDRARTHGTARQDGS